MKKNDFRKNFLQQTGACVLLIGSLAMTSDGDAATATGTATATVLEAVSVEVVLEPVPVSISAPALSGTVFTIDSFTRSLSVSGPLLRVGSDPSVASDASPSAVLIGAGAVPSSADKATVTVTLNANGSLSISGGSGLTFTVSQPVNGVINIEYN